MRKNRANRAYRPPPSLRLGDLRVGWLVTFLAVVRLKNRSLAAKELGISQGAVTKQIHSLEDWSRMPLVFSDSAPLRLTPQGQAFVAVAENALEILTKFRAIPPLEQAGPPRPPVSAKNIRLPPEWRTPLPSAHELQEVSETTAPERSLDEGVGDA